MSTYNKYELPPLTVAFPWHKEYDRESQEGYASAPGAAAPKPDDGGPGFFDLPTWDHCQSPQHNPPTHIYVPPGKGYRHICPACGKATVLFGSRIIF